MRVELGKKLLQSLKLRSKDDSLKVFSFVEHVKVQGLVNLEGRNKNSNNVPTDDPHFVAKVQRATEKKFWHYHIGIEQYKPGTAFGDRTSEWVLHYANHEPQFIRLAMLDFHPPFRLPHDDWLVRR